MIRTHDLTKRYGDLHAVDGLDLDVEDGDIYGFLGANGSGKTTTVRMLLGLVLPTSGEMEVLDRQMPGARAQVLPDVGCLVEGPCAYPYLSGRRNLIAYDALGGGATRRTRKGRVADALDRVGLTLAADRRVGGYSLGMRQRLGLAAALLGAPRLLILDEPTNGLDPQGIREMRELLGELNEAGTTIFLSSHLLAEVEQLCTRVGLLDRGRLVLQRDLTELRRATGHLLVEVDDPEAAQSRLGAAVVSRDGDRLVVLSEDPVATNAALVSAGVGVRSLVPERRSLEEVVLDATEGSGEIR